jgi:hypothetical protein
MFRLFSFTARAVQRQRRHITAPSSMSRSPPPQQQQQHAVPTWLSPPAGCACGCTTWKIVSLSPAADESDSEPPPRRDRLVAIASQIGLSAMVTVPRPLRGAAPAPAAAGDGGVLINTVLGEISTAELGWTSSHEHIFATDAKSSIIKHQYPDNLPGTFPRDYVVSEGTAALKLLCAQYISRICLPNNMQRSSLV